MWGGVEGGTRELILQCPFMSLPFVDFTIVSVPQNPCVCQVLGEIYFKLFGTRDNLQDNNDSYQTDSNYFLFAHISTRRKKNSFFLGNLQCSVNRP